MQSSQENVRPSRTMKLKLAKCYLSAIRLRGLPEEDAERFVEHLATNKEQLIKALAPERLNTSEEALSKPLVSALSGALSTAL